MPKEVNFFTEGIHPVKVKSVEKKTSAKGNDYHMISFYSGGKNINLFMFLPDGSRKYNPSSPQARTLESFLNYTVNADINPGSEDYRDKLVAGMELFATPSVFADKECKIQVGYPGVHVSFVGKGKFALVDKSGNPFLGMTDEYPTRDAAVAAFEQMNAKRDEPVKLFKFAEVLRILAPDSPNKVDKIVKKDQQLGQDEDAPFESDVEDDIGF